MFVQVLSKSAAIVEKPTNVSVTLGSDAVFSCKTHKSLKSFISWSKLTESGIVRLEEGSEVLHIHNVTENDLVNTFNLNTYCIIKLSFQIAF
jgi:hypothetical protein